MKEYLVPPLCGRTYLYGSQADASVSSRIVTALTMHINPEVLANALAEGISRFPQFAVGLAVENEEYVFCPVDAPVPVFEASASLPKTFGDPALAGYLFMVSYAHKTVYFDFHRSIADEFGMMSFVKAVLLRYLELSGYPVRTDGSVKLLSGEYFKAEGEDPMPHMDDVVASRPIWYMDAKAAVASPVQTDKEDVAQVRVPVAKLKKDYLDMTNIPVTYVAPFFSHAVHELIGSEIEVGEYVVAGVKVNLRPYYPSPSLRPYHTPVYLAYNRNLSDYPYNTVLMSQKKLLEAQLKNDTLAYSAQMVIAEVERVCEKAHTMEELNAAFDDYKARLAKKSTYEITRVGNVMMPDSMQRLVTEFYPVVPSGSKAFSVTVEVYRGELVITVCGRKNVSEVCRRLVELMQENSIEAYVADRYSFEPIK